MDDTVWLGSKFSRRSWLPYRKREFGSLLEWLPRCVSIPANWLGNLCRMSDVSDILGKIEDGDPSGADKLLPLVYEELRQLASAKMVRELPGQTLQPTALVHEAYLRLVDVERVQHWNSRGHFFAAAAESMRRILVERARQKLGPRRGARATHASLEDAVDVGAQNARQIMNVHEVLDDLERESSVKAKLVKLRYFAGLSHKDAAQSLGLSRATADRYWAYAKAFIYAALREDSEPEVLEKNSEFP